MGQVHHSLPRAFGAGASASMSVLVPAPWWPRGAAASRLPLLTHGLRTPPRPGPHTPALGRRRKEQLVHPTAEADLRPCNDFSSARLAAEVESP